MTNTPLLPEAISAVLAGVSVTFVVGTVVGQQYHLELLGKDKEAAYQRILTIWYPVGMGLALLTALFASPSDYPNRLALVTIVCWVGWCAHTTWRLQVHKQTVEIRFLFWLSAVCLGIVSALGVAAAVTQVQELIGTAH